MATMATLPVCKYQPDAIEKHSLKPLFRTIFYCNLHMTSLVLQSVLKVKGDFATQIAEIVANALLLAQLPYIAYNMGNVISDLGHDGQISWHPQKLIEHDNPVSYSGPQ